MTIITLHYHNEVKSRLLDQYLATSMTTSELNHYRDLLELTYKSQDSGKGYMLDISKLYHAIIDMVNDLYPIEYVRLDDDDDDDDDDFEGDFSDMDS